MATYETMLVTSATLDEEATQALVGKFKSLIEKHGSIEAVDEWGKRRLAYPINKEPDGVYTLIYFTSGPDFPAELDRVYKITDGVLRSLIVARDPDQPIPVKEEKPAPKAEAAPATEVPQAAPAPEAPAETAEAPAQPAETEAPITEEAPAEKADAPAEASAEAAAEAQEEA